LCSDSISPVTVKVVHTLEWGCESLSCKNENKTIKMSSNMCDYVDDVYGIE
jgi:hypothetical protein